MKPVIILTVHRRYQELAQALARLDELKGEFAEPPDVVLVWACPELGRLWYINELLEQGRLTHVVGRPALSDEGGAATSYPESHNIRAGLQFVKENYSKAYAIVQTADVLPKSNNAYRYFDQLMQEGTGAVVLHWPNGCVPREIWHTNFFAVKLEEVYWPPVLEKDTTDVLEWAWGKHLMSARPPCVEKSHNANEKRFSHKHISEHCAEWPIEWVREQSSLTLSVVGYRPFWRTLVLWCINLRNLWRKHVKD